MTNARYTTFNKYMLDRFGERVHKISVDAGFTCPNRDGTIDSRGCIYCDGNASRAPYCNPKLGIKGQILSVKEQLRRRYKANKFLVYFQPFTNTYAPYNELKKKYEEALQDKDIVGIAVGTRPDYVDETIIDLLSSYSDRFMVWLELGLQSVHERSLKWMRRGHDVESFRKAVNLAKSRNILVCTHIIVGIPGEKSAEVLMTVSEIVKLRIDAVKIHLLHILKGTDLEKLYNGGGLTLIPFDEYINTVCDIIEYLPKEVLIQRMTSDAPLKNLVAPLWTNEKQKIISAINDELIRRDSFQGKKQIEVFSNEAI